MTDTYQVRISLFEGPLALLLHLIEKRQMEITAISLVEVTDQFIEYLQLWENPPIASMAEFASMASRLLYIKSRTLLPRIAQPEDDPEIVDALVEAEELRRNLLEYQLARDIAHSLRERHDAGLQSFARTEPLQGVEETLVWTPPQLTGISVNALAFAYRRALEASIIAEPAELPLPIVTVAERMVEIEIRLKSEHTISLEALLLEDLRRIVIVVTFIAVLELWHQHRINVQQTDLFGTITIEHVHVAFPQTP